MNKLITQRKFESKKIFITAVISVIVFIAVILVVIATSSKDDLSKYVTISEVGYNGAGTLNIEIDTKQYLKDCHSDNKLGDVEHLEIAANVENNGNLSNGTASVITFTAVDSSVQFNSMEYTVNNLQDTAPVDVFEDLQLEFIGANGAGTATLNTEKCKEYIQAGVSFSIQPDSKLSNRDVVTVIAKEKNNTLLSSGYTLKTSQKEYTVQNLPVYPTSLDNINCNDCTTYFEKEISDLVKKNSISYPWELDNELSSNWYLLGNFDYEYVITPVANYFSYQSDNLQKNEYCSVYEVNMTATCTKAFTGVDTLKDKINKNNLSKNSKINGTLYFSITANSVYLDPQEKNLVLPLTDSNYNSDYYGRSYTAIEYNGSLYQMKKAITKNSKFDTVICTGN